MVNIFHQDSQTFLEAQKTMYDLIYIDPPYNTRKTQKLGDNSYDDAIADYKAFMLNHIFWAHKLLKPTGTMIVQCDWHEAHHIRTWMDTCFGSECFLNEIIWAYDYGARSKKKWSTKHDNIFIYVKDPNNYTFNYDAIERIPYMAPGLVGEEKAAKGKTLTDVWWHTIVPTNGKERVGYPTQKPLGIIRRFVEVHSNPGDRCLDFFAGSGTFGVACHEKGRHCDLVDSNPQAISVMYKRIPDAFVHDNN